jgi:two-component sensor histidine kinase
MMERQRVLADFGELALRSEDLQEVLTEACHLVGRALGTHLAKILEIEYEENRLLVRAGVGWTPGIVGKTRLPLSEKSSETYAIKSGAPLVTQDIHKEARFVFPDFMKAHGIIALVNVPIFVPGHRPYGLLQVDSREPREFGTEDIEFLRTYTTILGPVIDRLHKVRDLQVPLDKNQRLLAELQHRVKNNIAVITSLARMRESETNSEEARRELRTVGERIEALRLVHDQLHSIDATDRLSLRPYLTRLVKNLVSLHEGLSGQVRLDLEIDDVELSPDQAVPLGLIVNEFVTNSLKYAFDGDGGEIAVHAKIRSGKRVALRLQDSGKGLPQAPRSPTPGSGKGMRIIQSLAGQIGAQAHWSSPGGAALQLEFETA